MQKFVKVFPRELVNSKRGGIPLKKWRTMVASNRG
jgi:hypothetical protein